MPNIQCQKNVSVEFGLKFFEQHREVSLDDTREKVSPDFNRDADLSFKQFLFQMFLFFASNCFYLFLLQIDRFCPIEVLMK
jgi:hypothetical protein